MKKLTLAGILLITLIMVAECTRVDKISTRPFIKFTSFQTFDTTDILGNQARGGRLKFYFEDGDGDIGLDAPTTSDEDSTDLFFKMFRVTNGALVPAADNDLLKPSDYRIPYLSTIGQNTFLKGTITVTFMYLFYTSSDTIKYQFYIKDRAGNASDTVSTCEIPIVKDTVCKGE